MKTPEDPHAPDWDPNLPQNVSYLFYTNPEVKTLHKQHPKLGDILTDYFDAREAKAPEAALDEHLRKSFGTVEFVASKTSWDTLTRKAELTTDERRASLETKMTVLVAVYDTEINLIGNTDTALRQRLEKSRNDTMGALGRFNNEEKKNQVPSSHARPRGRGRADSHISGSPENSFKQQLIATRKGRRRAA